MNRLSQVTSHSIGYRLLNRELSGSDQRLRRELALRSGFLFGHWTTQSRLQSRLLRLRRLLHPRRLRRRSHRRRRALCDRLPTLLSDRLPALLSALRQHRLLARTQTQLGVRLRVVGGGL